jgi:hypothetical protein
MEAPAGSRDEAPERGKAAAVEIRAELLVSERSGEEGGCDVKSGQMRGSPLRISV